MAEGAVGHVGDPQLLSSVDQAIGFMQSLEGGVLCLDSINLGDCEFQSDIGVLLGSL